MKNSTAVVCDKCKKEFWLRGFENGEDTLKNGKKVVFSFFKCPWCGSIYIVSIEDGHSKMLYKEYLSSLSKQQDYIFGNLKHLATDDEKKEMYKVVKSNKKRYHDYTSRLKKKYIGELKRRWRHEQKSI